MHLFRISLSRMGRLALGFLAIFVSTGYMWAHGALHEKIAAAEKSVALAPKNPEARFALATLYGEHREWDHALAEVAVFERLAPHRRDSAPLKAQALHGLDRQAEAKVLLDAFLEKEPAHLQALTTRARVHTVLGRTEAAWADYRAVLRHSETFNNLDLTQEATDALSAGGFSTEAVEALDRAIARLGPIPSLLTRALALEAGLGRIDAAVGRLELLAQKDPRPEPWLLKRAQLLLQAGRIIEARDAAEDLHRHLTGLPNLERGLPALRNVAAELDPLLAQARREAAAPRQTRS